MVVTQKNSEDVVVDYTTDYGSYVLQSRAIPGLMDGFKPVQRRFMVSARDLKLWNNGATIKSAKVSGEVMGNYHPHGDPYGTLAGMVQDFKIRYPLFEGQGNWGCADIPGSVAASRYTEVKLSKFAEKFYLQEAEYSDTVANYDGRLQEISLFYPVLPGSLLTGASGIAIGISTNIPMQSVYQVADSMLAYMDDPQGEGFLDKIFPETAERCTILSTPSEIKKMYKEGKGSIRYQAKFHYETINGKPALVVDAFPPDFSKKRLETAAILEAVEKGKLEVHNESKSDIRYVFISDDREILTTLEERLTNSIGYRFYIDHRGVIKMYSLKEIFETFIEERKQFITRKYTILLDKAKYELDYLEVLYKLKQNKQYIKDMFDKTSDVVVQEIVAMYNTTDKIANRAISTSLRSLMADNIQDIQNKINDYQASVTEYTGYLNDPEAKVRKEVEDIRSEFANDEKRAVLAGQATAPQKLTFKGQDLTVDQMETYIIATPDNDIRPVMGAELLHRKDLDDLIAILPTDKKYYFAYDCRGICGMERDVLINSGNKFKSDTLKGLIATDDLTEIEVTLGNGKVQSMAEWVLRKRAGWQRMADDDQPCIKINLK